MNRTLTPEMTLAELALERPGASRIFQRLGLDYCCGGKQALASACAQRNLDALEILASIAEEDAQPDEARWTDRPLGELIDFIVHHYHARLRDELPGLIALARRVEERHAGNPACPQGLADKLEEVHLAVLTHLAKEEQVLFPLIQNGHGRFAQGPVQTMEYEHDEHGQNLAILRNLAHDYHAPAEACTSWQALYLRLDAFEAELMEHIHLENHVLFPRALGA